MSIAVSRFSATRRFAVRSFPAVFSTALAACAMHTPQPQPQPQPQPTATLPAAATRVTVPSPAPVRPLIAVIPAASAPPATAAVALPVATPVISQEIIEPARPLIPEPAAASADKIAALQTWVEQQDRLYRAAAPLLINNTELCPRHARNLLGLIAKTKYSYSGRFAAAAQAALGLDERLRVMNVLPGSGAAQAGILKGDILTTAEIEPLPSGPDAERIGVSLIDAEMQGRSSLNMGIERGNTRLVMHIPLTPACSMLVDLGDTDNVNSYADGNRIMVTRGMLNFVQSDEELAFVLAREIAHNILTPSTRMDMAGVIERLHTLHAPTPPAALQTRIAPFTPVLDATADKLSLYLLARAGHRISNLPAFWKRLAAAYPGRIGNSHTALHPSTGYRLSVINQIVQTIELKRKNDLPLIP